MSARRSRKANFSRWDAADSLRTEADMVAYLQACLDEAPDDAALFGAALGDIARARGMADLGNLNQAPSLRCDSTRKGRVKGA